jgi:iron complex outermembrane receptor protein
LGRVRKYSFNGKAKFYKEQRVQKKYFFFLVLNLHWVLGLQAQNSTPNFHSFLEGIDNYVQTNQINIDHQASVLTVIHSNELKTLGVNSLQEALEFIPGIQTIVSTGGRYQIVARGNASINNSSNEKVKFFINGVSIQFFYYANFPLELIERIEVMRGGVSSIYGQGALLGAINIVTKTAEKEDYHNITIGSGSFNTKKATAVFNHKINNWYVNIDTHYLEHNKRVEAQTGTPAPTFLAGAYERDKESLEGVDEKSVGILIQNDYWNFSTRYIKSITQNANGFSSYVDFDEEGYSKHKTTVSQLSYKNSLVNGSSFQVDIGSLENSSFVNTYIYKIEPTVIPTEYGNIKIYDPHYQMDYALRTQYAQCEVKHQVDKHNLSIGIYEAIEKVTRNNLYTNANPLGKVGLEYFGHYLPIDEELTKLSGEIGLLNNPDSQRTRSYFLKNQYSLHDHLNLMLNVRMTHNKSFGKSKSYRLAGVYSEDNSNIFKLIYANASSLPTYLELFFNNHFGVQGNPSLQKESIDSLEAVYIYSSLYEKFQLNSYYAIHNDIIELVLQDDQVTNEYQNASNKYSNYGIEFEYQKSFHNRSKFLLNGSYTRYKYKTEAKEYDTPLASKVMLLGSYIYPFNAQLNWSNTIKHYSSKKLLIHDKIDSATLIDTTVSYNIKNAFLFTCGIQNLLDTKYYFYGYNNSDEKMLRQGRTFFTNFSYSF